MVEPQEQVQAQEQIILLPLSVKDILDRYDVNALLTRALPEQSPSDTNKNKNKNTNKNNLNNYSIELYKSKSKFDTPTPVALTPASISVLKSYASNHPDYEHSVILAYLLEMVCDVSKIQTKQVAAVIDAYYKLLNDKSRKPLLNRLLSSLPDYYQPTERTVSQRS